MPDRPANTILPQPPAWIQGDEGQWRLTEIYLAWATVYYGLSRQEVKRLVFTKILAERGKIAEGVARWSRN